MALGHLRIIIIEDSHLVLWHLPTSHSPLVVIKTIAVVVTTAIVVMIKTAASVTSLK